MAPSQSLPGAGANHKGWRTGVSQLPITGGQATVTRRQAPMVNRLIGEQEPTREASGRNCERTPAAGAATRGREQLGGEAYDLVHAWRRGVIDLILAGFAHPAASAVNAFA